MKYVILIAILACFAYAVYSQNVLSQDQLDVLKCITKNSEPEPNIMKCIYSVYPQDPKVEMCVLEKWQKCKTTCKNDYIFTYKFENGDIDWGRINCCALFRCRYCVEKNVQVDVCGPSGQAILAGRLAEMQLLLKGNNCDKDSKEFEQTAHNQEPEALKCIREKFETCGKTCRHIEYFNKQFKDETIDSTRNYCFEVSRCVYCLTKKVGVDVCGPVGKQLIEQTLRDFETAFKIRGCTESQRHEHLYSGSPDSKSEDIRSCSADDRFDCM